MRFVLAIVTFVVAAAMIGVGIAQRTVWAPDDHLTAQVEVGGDAPFTVISGKVLNAHPGQQTLRVSGTNHVFVAYGRTSDVLGWLGDERYARVSFGKDAHELTSKVVAGKSSSKDGEKDDEASGTGKKPAPSEKADADAERSSQNPAGSDLWLAQFDSKPAPAGGVSNPDVNTSAPVTRMNVPDSVSVIIADDGTKPAPANVRIQWPLDTSTPWSGPLLVGGGILLIISLLLYLWAIISWRRSRGPRRKGDGGPKMPRLPRPPRYRPQALDTPGHGRRAIRRSVVASLSVAVAVPLLLTGCSPKYWPDFGGGSSPSATPTPLVTDLPKQADAAEPPAVTVPQLEHIMTKISAVAKTADAEMNADKLKTRFAGPALEMRKANYALRKAVPDTAAPHPIPPSPLSVVLPQATDTWPRVVETVVQDKTDKKVAPIMLVLRQQTARDNYMVTYAIPLEADARVPDLAPAAVGTSIIPPNTKLLTMAPDQLSKAYADIIANGDKSQYAAQFDTAADKLRDDVGPTYREKKKADLPDTASVAFTDSTGVGKPIAMATNDSGAIVTASLRETETVKPVQEGATVNPEGRIKALTGVDSSTTGIQSVYAYQLLFYVPPANSDEKIRLLGYVQGLISASEVQ